MTPKVFTLLIAFASCISSANSQEIAQKGSSTKRADESPRWIVSLQEEVNNFFDTLFHRNREKTFSFGEHDYFSRFPSVDIFETSEEYVMNVELPGIDRGDIELKVGEDYITLRGKKKLKDQDEGIHYMRREASWGRFNRTLSLPKFADPKSLKATLKSGVLRISLLKNKGLFARERIVTIQESK